MSDTQPPELKLTPCDRAQETIFSVLEAEPVSIAEQDALTLHLTQCQTCQVYRETMGNLSLSMMELEEVPVPIGLENRVMARIALGEQTSLHNLMAKQNRSQWKKYGSIAAAVLVLAVAIPLVFQSVEKSQTVALRNGTTDEMILEQSNNKRLKPQSTQGETEGKPQTNGEKEQRDQLVESTADGAQLAFAGSQLRHTYASETESDVYYDPVSTLVGF